MSKPPRRTRPERASRVVLALVLGVLTVTGMVTGHRRALGWVLLEGGKRC